MTKTNSIPEENHYYYMGEEVKLEKKIAKISRIEVNNENVDLIRQGKVSNNGYMYLGRVVFPSLLFTLEIPILWNKEHSFPFAILAGESQDGGFCNLKITSPTEEEDNGVKAILDLKTAAIQAFCKRTGLPAPKRDKNAGGSCSSCKHKRRVFVLEEGEHREVCALDGSIIDSSWKKFNKEMEVKDRGLMGKKEHDTFTYEHAIESPIEGAKDGRYKYKSTFKSIYTDDSVNCPYYAAWFHHAKTNKWITSYSRELPWEGTYIIGSEVVVDTSDVLNPEDLRAEQIDKALKKAGLNREILNLMATHPKTTNATREDLVALVKSVAKCRLTQNTIDILVDEIVHLASENK